jgi:serine phosphatase RsbU (regulator of sigma subunit)/Tfp pilus assembly protein PilF
MASCYGNIGMLHMNQNDLEKALEYFFKALDIDKERVNPNTYATVLGNIGIAYYYQHDLDKARDYWLKASEISETIGDKNGVCRHMGNIGNIYLDQKDYPKALEFYFKALKMSEQVGDVVGRAVNLGNIGNVYLLQEKYVLAEQNLQKALELCETHKMVYYAQFYYDLISKVYEKTGQNKKALAAYKNFVLYRDSIINEENQKAIIQKEVEFNYEKKLAIDSIANAKSLQIKDLEIKQQQEISSKQRLIIIFGILSLILLIAFTILVIQRLNLTRKQKQIIEDKNQKLDQQNIEITAQHAAIEEKNEELNQLVEEVTSQRDEIESQRDLVLTQKDQIETIHHEISESINYATRIQKAILPETKILDQYLSEHFVLFKPKDKVSGDFYWWTHIENHTVITAADSTGHGVPGAFMSMLGSSYLREIVQKEYITHTGVILRKLRKEIIKSLKQKGEMGEQKDGMDMAIISIDHETNKVQFSGANNPLYILTNRKLEHYKPLPSFENFYEIKPDKMPISIYQKMDNFTAHEFQLEKGDLLFMFSDGFADQFGGPRGKKFKYKPFKRLLSENRELPLAELKNILNQTFIDWKGELDQIDDVVVLGLKL